MDERASVGVYRKGRGIHGDLTAAILHASHSLRRDGGSEEAWGPRRRNDLVTSRRACLDASEMKRVAGVWA